MNDSFGNDTARRSFMRGRLTFGGFDAFGGFTGFGSFGTAARCGFGNRACSTSLAASSA